MAESTSKLRAQVKALTNVNGSGGVDILADEKTFRSTYDIMSDIADVWSGMSDIDQSALLELLAGKVRSNQVAALLSNFDQAEKALETSQNAEGTMDKVHRAWMDSVEARKAQFEAAQETLSMTVMPANTLKGLYQTGTSALGLLNTVVGATSPVGFGAGIFGVANALRSGGGNIAAGLGNMFGLHRDTFNGGLTRGDLGFVNAYNAAFSQTGDKQAAFNQAISRTNKQLDSYTMSLYSNTSGMIDASKVTKGFGSQIASFAKNAAVGLAAFGAMELAAWGLNAAWQAFDEGVLHRSETLANNAATAHAEYEAAQNQADSASANLKSAQEQAEELRSKPTLTASESQQLVDLESQIRTMAFMQRMLNAQAQQKAAEAFSGWNEKQADQRQRQLGAESLFHNQLDIDPSQLFGDNYSITDVAQWLASAVANAYTAMQGAEAGSHAYNTAEDAMRRMHEAEDALLRGDYESTSEFLETSLGRDVVKAAAEYTQSERLTTGERAQGRVQELERQYSDQYADKSLATIRAQAEALSEQAKQMGDLSGLTPEAIAEGYSAAKGLFDQLTRNAEQAGDAVSALSDVPAVQAVQSVWTSLQSAVSGAMLDLQDDVRTGFQDYAGAGYQGDTTYLQQAVAGYMALRKVLEPNGDYDAIRNALKGSELEDAIAGLDLLAAQSTITSDTIKGLKVDGVEDAGAKLGQFLEWAGLSLADFADMVNLAQKQIADRAGGDGSPAKVDTYGKRKTSVAGVFAAQDTGEKLWSSSGFSGTMTMDDYEHMMALDDGAYQAAIQYANGGLFFNKDVFDKLVQQKYREELNGLRKDVADTQKKYAEAAERLTAQAEKKRTGAADFDEMAMNAANDDLQTAAKELAGYRAMQAMIQNGMTDYANWLRNKSGPESGDMYDELGVAAQAILSGKQSGKVGTRQFEAAMRLYTGQENFDVNNLTKKDWSTLRGLSGVDSTGKAVEGLAKQTLFGIRNELQSMGILGKNFEILDKNMTAERMSELYNKQYGANTNSEFMTGLFMALNDYIQNPANKYQIGATETPEDVAMQDAAREFAKIAKDFKDGKATAEDLLAAAGKLDEATNTALQTTGTEDAQDKAEEMVDAKTQADTLASIDKSLSNLVDISQQQLDVQTGKQSTTKDDNAGGGQGGAGGEGGAGAETEETQAGGVNGYNKYLAAMAEHNKRPTGSGTTTDPRDSLNALLDSEAALDAFGELSGEALNQWRGYQEAAEQAAAEGDIPALIQNMSALGRMIAETNKATAEQRSQQEQERQKAEEREKLAAQEAENLERANKAKQTEIDQEQELQAIAAATAQNQLNAYAESKEVALAAEAGGEEGRNAINNAFAEMQKAIDSGDWDAFNNEWGKLTSQIHAINQRAEQDAKLSNLENERANQELQDQADLNEAMAIQAAEREAEARASATEAAQAELDRMTKLGGQQMAEGAVDAYNALNEALTSESANAKEISNLTQTLRGLNDATEEAQNAAQQAAEAQAKEDQRNRLLEAATPDAVAAIEDQQSQAKARGEAETAARKALEEEAAAAENALRETNAQRYGEAYDKAMTSPYIDHGGPGQKALEQAFDQIGAAFEAGDWEAFESAMQNLDQVTAAVAAADQERREREQQESDDRAAGEALQARLEEQRQNAEPPTVSTDLDKPLTKETAVSAVEETTATLAELAQADQERVAAEQEQSNLLVQNVQGQEDLTEAVQDNQPPEQPAVSTDFDTPLTEETGVSAAESKAMEQALLAQEEAARQQMDSAQELSEAVQDNTEQVAANTAATEQAAETASQEQRAKDAADLDRQEREERAKSDAAAGKALQDRLDTQSKLDQQAQWQEQLASAVEQAGGLGGITDPELRRSVENATQALEGYNTDGKVIPEQDITDQITGAIDGMQGYLQTQVDQGQENSVQNKKLADLEAERARKDAQSQRDMSDALRETASQAPETTTATGSSFSDMQAATEAMSDLDRSVGEFGAAHDLTQAQQDTLSEISASLNQEYANLGEATRAFDSATDAMNQLTSEVTAREQTEGVQQTPPAAGGSMKSTEEPVDTTTSASVEPEIPSTNKEVSVDTKSATISLPSGKLGISEDLSMEGWSKFYSLDNSSYAGGMRPNGEALSEAEVQAVNNALTALQQALTGDDAQALTAAMGTATQIMQGNISVSPSATEAVQSGSGSGGGGGGQAPVTQATVQVTAETPEIPTPEAPSVTIPVTAEEADIPTPAVPSVVIPVSYGDPGSLSVEQPAGVTIPVAWGDPGPAPGGGGGVTLSAPMAAASGTENARGGTTLVDELGAELIEHRSRGTYELGTDRGARFTKLDPGDIVHNAKETSKILHRGKAMWRGGVETGRAAAASLAPDYSGKTRYTFTADNITVNAKNSTPGTSMQGGNMSSSAGDDLYKWLTSPEHAMQQAMQEHSRIQHGPSANIDEETGERIGKEFLEWLKKLIDWIPTYLSVLKKKTTAFINATDDAIHYLSKNQLLDDAIGNVAEEIKANMQAVMRYQDFLNEMAGKGFSQDIIDKIQNGTIDIKEYGDEDTVKSIQAYQEYWNKLVACREALQSLNAQMEALSAQKLEHVVDYFDRIDSLLRDQQKTFESLLSMKKQYGEELKVTDYVDSLQTMEQVLANAQNEETALIQELKDQLGVDGDLVNAILKGGREVWDTIAEHVKKNTYSIVEDVKPEVQEAYAESRKNAQKEEETSKKQASTFTINGTTYYKTSSGKFRSMTNGSYITASAAKQAIQTQQETAEETKPEDLDFSITDVPVTPITDEEIIELGEKLGMVMTDGSEEALANFETIKSLLTTSWEHPLAIGSDTWYEYMSTLERLRESIYSTKTEIGELKDEMADIPLTNLKTGFDYLDEIQRNLEDMNSLLDAQGSAKYEDTYRSLISVGMKQIENLQEQNKLIQEQMNGLDPLSEKYQELRSNLNGNLDTIADIRKSQEEWNDEIIDLQIERLRKQNDSYKEQLRLMEALDDLDKARQRRLLIYHEDTGFQYEADEDELESAQEAANDAIFNNIISDLEKSKADSNIYGPLGERLISGSSILDSLGNVLVPVEDKLSGLDFEPYYQSIVSWSEQSGLLEGLLQSIDLSKLLEASIGGGVNIDIGTMTLNEVQNAKDLGDAIINQLPSYLLQALYKKGAN